MQAFDLNIEKVLEHWPVAYAVREIIANALDEATITQTAEPTVEKIGSNRWLVTDFGRGIRYQHLTQNENIEKARHTSVIGQFGMGLKDALAVFDRHGIDVQILSPFGDISTALRAKEGFPDVTTLHAIVDASSNPNRIGTSVILTGVKDVDVSNARTYFLRYSGELVLEETEFGQVLAHPGTGKPANIYVKGLRVATEENFLFSYNITSLKKPLRQALNRERSNVGRGAYSDRIQSILMKCTSGEVARSLADNLGEYRSGRVCDELRWNDVTVHACRVLATHEKVVFVTAGELADGGAQIEYAKDDGYQLVMVSDDVARKLSGELNLNGEPLITFNGYRDAWNDSFSFQFVDPAQLVDKESRVWNMTDEVVRLSGVDLALHGVKDILISETMRLGSHGDAVAGVFESGNHRIVIRRDQLANPVSFCGTLVHELVHAATRTDDLTLEFEQALTQRLGLLAFQLAARGQEAAPLVDTRSSAGPVSAT